MYAPIEIPTHPLPPRTNHSERGVFVVIAALVTFALVGLLALVVDIALLSTTKIRLERIADISSVAALDGFNSTNGTYAQKIQAGLERVNFILPQNPVPMLHALGDISLIESAGDMEGPGGALTFGNWVTSSTQCSAAGKARSPCFVPNLSGQTSANAARLVLHNQNTNPLNAVFARVFGNAFEHFFVNADSITTLTPRCNVFLLDVSASTTSTTNRWYELQYDLNGALTPPGEYSLFAFAQQDAVTQAMCQSYCNGGYCSYPDVYKSIWCSMGEQRSAYSAPNIHFRSDYVAQHVPFGGGQTYLVDKYVDSHDPGGPTTYLGPEPLTSFFRAIHVALDEFNRRRVAGDKTSVLSFDEAVLGPGPGSTLQLTDNFDYLRQLTNPNNRGTMAFDPATSTYSQADAEFHPNFVDRGWLPQRSKFTDIITGLDSAISLLANDRSCDGAAKSIELVTDGLGNCNPYSTASCGNTISNYESFEYALYHWPPNNRIIDRAIAGKIRINVYPFGFFIKPHILNVESDEWRAWNQLPQPRPMPPPARFIGEREARALNYSGWWGGDRSKHFLDLPPFGWAPRWNAMFSGQADMNFRRVLGYLFDLARDSVGQFCPLMTQPAATDCEANPREPGELQYKESLRVPGQMLEYSPACLSIADQARDCMLRSIGLNPYRQVLDWNP
ncbi:MAG: hypothetical protein K1X79_03070 [Oligoflexia bacterium]|nr:hypothetical protein [Oligoflexia bacterium]